MAFIEEEADVGFVVGGGGAVERFFGHVLVVAGEGGEFGDEEACEVAVGEDEVVVVVGFPVPGVWLEVGGDYEEDFVGEVEEGHCWLDWVFRWRWRGKRWNAGIWQGAAHSRVTG